MLGQFSGRRELWQFLKWIDPEFGRGLSGVAFEDAIKEVEVVETAVGGDLFGRFGGIEQLMLGAGEPELL